MKQTASANTAPVLARWSYTKNEWKQFSRWENWRRGLLGFLLKKLKQPGARLVQDVVITEDSICFDHKIRSLHDSGMQVRRISISESGPVNTLEIIYEQQTGNRRQVHEIMIPVPKGKLREAVMVQDRLQEAFGI